MRIEETMNSNRRNDTGLLPVRIPSLFGSNIRFFIACSLFLLAAYSLHGAPESKPNVVLILVDDLGWQDVKCYDIDEPSPMETPNLDALARKGVQFWQGYSPAPVCAPSRAAILSGLHPARCEMTSVAGGIPPHAGHPNAKTIPPFYTARMPVKNVTLAEAMKAHGYVTAHSGKWHISQNHYDYPTPYYHGFDESTHDRGVQTRMIPDRLTGFATRDPKDPYRLDENGMPFDVPQDAALRFIRNNKDKPFFLYYATWLVHTPIVMRSEALLRKYEKKLGLTLSPEDAKGWDTPGQTNPFYCAMVEQLDYYLGQLFTYLETTDDPRRPGHKLIENTYVIFSSDNGGMEGGHGEIITDNYPLDRGKISLREGGIRVPLIIAGPGIPAGVQTDVMANGLDFYPTILSLVGAGRPEGKIFDGCDLKPLLTGNPKDPSLVRDSAGSVRDTMFWHFPQSENTSSIRVGDYKLLRSYQSIPATLKLTKLYNTGSVRSERGDIEEVKDLSASMPEKAAELDELLSELIEGSGGRLPYLNPVSKVPLTGKEQAPEVLSHRQRGQVVEVSYRHNGADVVHADLIYSSNNGREWLRSDAEIVNDSRVLAVLPDGTSHYFINLVDENNFLEIYPAINRQKMNQEKLTFSDVAVFAGYPEPEKGDPVDRKVLFGERTEALAGRSILASFDFEDEAMNELKGVHFSGDGAYLSDNGSGNRGQSLCLKEVEGLERNWMPLVNVPLVFPPEASSGVYRATMDLRLDAKRPGSVKISFRKGRAEACAISFGPETAKAGFVDLAGLEPGTWYHLDVSAEFGADRDYQLSILLYTEDGRRWFRQEPILNTAFDRPAELQIIGLGDTGSSVQIDNLVVTSSNALVP